MERNIWLRLSISSNRIRKPDLNLVLTIQIVQMVKPQCLQQDEFHVVCRAEKGGFRGEIGLHGSNL